MIGLHLPKPSFQTVWKLETRWKLKTSKTNGLSPISVSSWKPRLETWKPCPSPLSAKVTGESSVSSLSPTPKGVRGSRQRLRLATPPRATRHCQSSQSKNRVATHPAKNVVATLTTPQAMEKRYG